MDKGSTRGSGPARLPAYVTDGDNAYEHVCREQERDQYEREHARANRHWHGETQDAADNERKRERSGGERKQRVEEGFIFEVASLLNHCEGNRAGKSGEEGRA